MSPAAFVLAVALAMTGGGAACGGCGNTFIAEHLSPDSAHELIIYERSCGPMTGFSTHVTSCRRFQTVARRRPEPATC